MKKYKILIIIGIIISSMIFLMSATGTLTVNKTQKSCTQGQYVDFGGAKSDTIIASDTVNYYLFCEHTNDVTPYISFTWTKTTGNPTVTLKFYQSLDGVNYTAVPTRGTSAYTKTITPTASTSYYYSFQKDTVLFEGRFLEVSIITPVTTCKAIIGGRVKFTIK